MGTSRRKRSIIAHLIRQDADGKDVYVSGGDRIVAAFNARDIDVLKAVLQEHPEAWKTEMPWPSTRAFRQFQVCVTVKLAVALNWGAGLEVLLNHGADPNFRHEDAGKTALDLAVRKLRIPMVKRLLKSGARFERPDGLITVHAMFREEYSVSRMEKCWKVMDALVAAGLPVWTRGQGEDQTGSSGVLLRLLSCLPHPDGGIAQALRLMEKFPVPPDRRAEVSEALAIGLPGVSLLWRYSSPESNQISKVASLFESLSAQGILPAPRDFVAAAVLQHCDAPENIDSASHAWIQEVLALRVKDCNAQDVRIILKEFGEHPCLNGAAGAWLSSLALQDTATPAARAHKASRF